MKKLYSLLFTSIIATATLSVVEGLAQGSWIQKADFGGAGRENAVSFVIGTKCYTGTGYYGGAVRKDFWMYDATTNVWTQNADFGGSARAGAVGFAVGNLGYLGTGYDGVSPFTTDFWEYNPSNNTWTQKANFSGSARYGSIGFEINGKGYIGTGDDGSYRKDFWLYNPSNDTWTQKSDFGGIGRVNAVGFSIRGKGYIGTGEKAGGILANDFWEYDTLSNTWTQKTNFAGTARSGAVGFVLDSTGFIGIGYDGSAVQKDFWEYNSLTNTWIQKSDFNGTARNWGVGFSIGRKGYIGIGGNNASGIYYNDVWQFNPYNTGFTTSADSICMPDTITFVNTTNDPDAYIYWWQFSSQGFSDTIIDTLSTSVQYIFDTLPGTWNVSITVFDTNYVAVGSYSMAVYVSKITSLNLTSSSSSCSANTGTAMSAPSGGVMPYTYLWSNNGTTQTITGLSAGYYSMTVTDKLGCASAKDSVFVTKYCFAASDDSICIPDTVTFANTTNDPDAYTYEWWFMTPGYQDTVKVFDTLSTTLQYVYDTLPGTHHVQMFVYDTNGTSLGYSSLDIYVSAFSSHIISSAPDTCTGTVGSAMVNATGATQPYTYLWSNNGTNQTINGLAPATYTVTVSDALGCSLIDSIMVGSFTGTVTVSFASIPASCMNADGSLAANPVGGTSPYSYVWSSGSSMQAASNLASGNYTLTITDKNGCMGMDTANVGISSSVATPSICMVTVDSISQNNVIMWDKTPYQHIDSFIVYRETSANIYNPIGAVHYDSLSLFVDTVRTKYFPNTGDPNAGTYRYKLQMRDSCGNYSALSSYHNTIYITNNSGTFLWPQLYTIEGASNPVTNYVLMRDNNSTGNWTVVNSVTGSQQTVTDPQYSTYQSTAKWRVETQWGISCNPTRINPEAASFNASRSNIFSNVNSVNEYYNNSSVSIYPNPTSGKFTIYSLQSEINSLEIYDLFGNSVFQTTLSSKQEAVSTNLSTGMYFYKVFREDKLISTGKLIIQ